MITRERALEAINEMTKVLRQGLTIKLPSNLFIVIGAGIAAIPLLEFFLEKFIDPLFVVYVTFPVMFGLRTIFYWMLFSVLSRLFICKEEVFHPAIKMAWSLNPFFPIVLITTAAMLALSGFDRLIMPIVLVLVGCYFALIGRFTQLIVTILAVCYMAVGIGSIYLASLPIVGLWQYLIVFQGLASVVVGLILWFQESKNK